MLAKDRMKILKILSRQASEQKARLLSKSSKSKGVDRSHHSKTFSNTSILYVNKDWEHCVSLQGCTKAADADVCGIGGLIVVKYKGDKGNIFNVLSKEVRRGFREEVGRIFAKGEYRGCCVGC